eukprot:sb/3475163/
MLIASTHYRSTSLLADYNGIEIDEKILNLFMDEDTGLEVSLPKFFKYLERHGIHPLTDPRFVNVIELFKSLKSGGIDICESNPFPETLDIEEFYRLVQINFQTEILPIYFQTEMPPFILDSWLNKGYNL